ncbi:MAG TPA: hypothetical protein VGM23_05705 [Armatimonadota bacterium]|jgi:hypothetical protein
MSRKWLPTLWAALPVLACGLAVLLPVAARAQTKRPAVLILGVGGKAEVKLREMGFQTKVMPPVSLVQQSGQVDLTKFNVILAASMPASNELADTTYQLTPKSMTKMVGLLNEYVKAGGAILFYGPWGGYDGVNEFLKPLGAAVLTGEAVDDPVHSYQQPDYMRATATVGTAGEKYTKGQTWNYRYALLASSYDEPGGVQTIERLRREFGLTGQPPAYTVKAMRGTVKGTRLLLELEAQDGGFVADIAKADLCMPIPIRLAGLHDAWSAVVAERSGKWYRPIPVRDGVGHLSLDTRKADQALFIGHPITCDRKDIRLTLIPDGQGHFGIEVHNPTEKEVKTVLRVTPDNGIFPGRPPAEVTIPAGASITL